LQKQLQETLTTLVRADLTTKSTRAHPRRASPVLGDTNPHRTWTALNGLSPKHLRHLTASNRQWIDLNSTLCVADSSRRSSHNFSAGYPHSRCNVNFLPLGSDSGGYWDAQAQTPPNALENTSFNMFIDASGILPNSENPKHNRMYLCALRS